MRKQYFFLIILILFSPLLMAQYGLYEDGIVKYKDKDYESSIKLLSDFLTKATRDKKFDVDAYYYRALSYYKKDNYKNAISDFEEAILLDHENKGNIYWFKAKSEAKLGSYQESVNDYTSALKELGSDANVKAKLLYERSLVYMKLGNIQLAYDDLQGGNTADPNNAEIKKELDTISKQGIASRSTESGQKKGQQTPNRVTENKAIKKEEPVVVKQQVETSQQIVKNSTETSVVPVKPTAKVIQPAPQVITTPTPVATNPLAEVYKDERRFALVIGNSMYPKEIGALKNPVNDATDIAKELRESNFQVDLLTNATYGQMRAAMLKFKEKVDAGDRDKTVSLFYYAGHGLQHEDENYLVPIDASIAYEDDISRFCFPVQRMILSNMERSNSRMNIVILDACRNNPFPSITRSVGQQGLGEMKRGRGAFIAYATAPGSVASDGNGRNGLYTQELLKAMRKPGLTIEQVFKEVRQSVLRMSGDKQNTWDSSNIIGDFYFKF